MGNTFIIKVKRKSKVSFTETLLKSFDFLEVVREKPKVSKTISTKKQKDLVNALKEVKLHLEGKKKLKTADDFLKEL